MIKAVERAGFRWRRRGTELASIPCAGRILTAVVVVLGLAVCLGLPSGAQAANSAWKVLATAMPTHLPPRQSEVQRVTIEAEGGTFDFTHQSGESTATPVVHEGSLTLVEGSPVATIASVESGAAFGVGDRITEPFVFDEAETTIVSCSTDCETPGSTVTLSNPATVNQTAAPFQIFTKELTGLSGSFAVGDEVTGTIFPSYFPANTVVTAVGPDSATLSNPTTFEAFAGEELFGGVTITSRASADFDASAQEVQSALEGLFGPRSVEVSGGPGGNVEHPYLVDFGGAEGKGPLADQDVEELDVAGASLSGPHAAAHVFTTIPGGNGTGEIAATLSNVGGAPSSGETTVQIGPLPAGVVIAGPGIGEGGEVSQQRWACPGQRGDTVITCTTSEVVPSVSEAELSESDSALVPESEGFRIPLEVEGADARSGVTSVQVSGGESSETVLTEIPIEVSPIPAKPGIAAFWAGAFEADGTPSRQAGGHPFSAMSAFALNTVRMPSGNVNPAADPKDVDVDLPPGFLGDPLITPRCPQSRVTSVFEPPVCNLGTRVGSLTGFIGDSPEFSKHISSVPVNNDIPSGGSAAEFSSEVGSPIQSLTGSVRSKEDFGVRISAVHVPTFNNIFGSFVVLYGKPLGGSGGSFLVNPTDCAGQRQESEEGRGPATRIDASSWQEPTEFAQAEDPLPLLTGCGRLTEAWLGHGPEPEKEVPSFSFQPTTMQASSPTGATADLHVPQEGLTDPNKLASSDLKKAIVTLPRGLTVNPSSANGLEACSEAQVGYLGNGFLLPNPTHFDEQPVTCPDGSKLGTFEISTPLLEEPVEGTIYLATQEENPFQSLIALYLVVENQRFGLTLKLPGEVKPDPTTGQLTATFDNNPQLPFEDLTLHFRGGGPRSTLATPETCGHFETTGSLEPWSAENGQALPIHEVGFSTNGGCASSEGARRFAPSFEAGTTSTQAGAFAPLVIKVNRNDGEQELKSLDFTLPKGLTGKLAGIPYCPESAIQEAEHKSGKAEQASASCPSASQIGTVDTAAGVGSEPIHVGGKVYLAGPYKGAPLSSVVVTPAVAGPFDLGDVVIRAPLFVDPETAEITAKSDPIPAILKGIPLKVRSVTIDLDRSGFTLNPTSCSVMLATASISGSSGATASPNNRFQVGGCKQLKFKPTLKISLSGATKRTGQPALKAVVTYPKQGAYANIRRAQVNLPHSEFLEQNNLNKTCTRPVLLEGKCPKTTIYGKAKAWTPLLDKPLQGPVYLVGGYGFKLPALVAELDGQIRIVLKGKVDSGPNKGIRNTFEAVPDAPVSRFVLEMKGGKKYGLLINSENLCKKPQRANALFTAQNGLVDQTKPLIANQCGKKETGKKSQKGKKKH